MHDAAFFERRGVPAAPVATEEFRLAAEFQAKALFAEPYPIVWTPHPVAQLDRESIRALAAGAVEAIRARLVAPS